MANAINYQEIMEELAKPFDVNELKWRVITAANCRNRQGKFIALVCPYISSKSIVKRLDDVLGPYWKDQYEPVLVSGFDGIRCSLSLKINDEWISREDAAGLSNIEPIKGGFSNALKRASSKWGLGRYIHDLSDFWVEVNDSGQHKIGGEFTINQKNVYVKGYFNTPKLPTHALPVKTQNKPQQQPSNNSTQQKTQQAQQIQGQPSTCPNEEEKRQQAFALVTSQLQYLGVPLNSVPQLLEQSGSNVPYDDASAEQLGKLYHLLVPTVNYVKHCRNLKVEKDGILYFANLKLAHLLKQSIKEIYEIAFYMSKELAEEASILVTDDMTFQHNQNQVS